MRKKFFLVNTAYGSHTVVLEPDERRGYIVVAPALPGVITWGETIAHAKEMAKEAIEVCIESLVETRSHRQEEKRISKARRSFVHAGV